MGPPPFLYKTKYMIKSIIIEDNTKLPLSYKLESLKNGITYNFINGVNIIIGKNGSGKSTLLNNIASYLLCSHSYYSKLPNSSTFGGMLKIDNLFNDTQLKNGMKVKCDYAGVVYNYTPSQQDPNDVNMLLNYIECGNKSFGEKTKYEICALFDLAFSNKDVQFPIKEIVAKRNSSNDYWKSRFNNLLKYYKENALNTTPEEFSYTFLIDEPDKNLDIENIEEIYKVLSYKKEMTQLICVIHNPILIYKLSKLDYINWIELSNGYLDKIKEVFNELYGKEV